MYVKSSHPPFMNNIAMKNPPICKNSKSSIFMVQMGHGFHGYVSHNQMVNHHQITIYSGFYLNPNKSPL